MQAITKRRKGIGKTQNTQKKEIPNHAAAANFERKGGEKGLGTATKKKNTKCLRLLPAPGNQTRSGAEHRTKTDCDNIAEKIGETKEFPSAL